MFNIREFTVEKITDPFGIIEGDRYEFLIYIDVEEDDELYAENGVYLKVLFGNSAILQYSFFENTSNKGLDFALEEDEEAFILDFCEKNAVPDEE